MNAAARPAPRPDAIDDWLQTAPCRIGEILIVRRSAGEVLLCHRDDAERSDLVRYTNTEDAVEIARFDDAGGYRPLKTAPNLRHGWRLILPAPTQARAALNYFYPGRAAVFLAWKSGALKTTALREALNRQTGMYRVAAKIGDEQADALVGNFCRSDGGCLRTILWRRDATTSASTFLPPEKFDPACDQTGRGEGALPLLCQEACNLLVAEARKIVKAGEE